MDGWDAALLAVAAAAAVMALVQLMRGHRDRLLDEAQRQARREQRRGRPRSGDPS